MYDSIANCAVFSADFPDDDKWSNSQDLIIPGGFQAAKVLVGILIKAGFNTAGPEQNSWHGWWLAAKAKNVKVECYFTDLKHREPTLLTTVAKGGWFRGKEKVKFHHAVVEDLKQGIQEDGHFIDVEWMTSERAEMEGRP